MSQLIHRDEALRHCALFENSPYKILMIQAQAGQGKTVLATQFDEASTTPFAWVTGTRTTNSPRLLFEKVLSGIASALPNFSQEAIVATLNQQLVDAEFLEIAPNRLRVELEALKQPLMLVFDDVHLLESDNQTKLLLKKLTELTPNYVKFVLISRYPVTLDDEPLFPSSAMIQIDKSLLAFSREEIAILYNEVLEEPATTKKIQQLHEATEGWISGLKLLHTSGTIRRLVHADNKSLGLYFDELLLPSLTPAEYQEMVQLALLEELPEEILRSLASNGVVVWIEELVSKNCFARVSRGESVKVFRLHHIFQEYLATQAENMLTEAERNDFLSKAAHEYIDKGWIKEGLRYLTKAKNWESLADAMQTHSLPLLGLNHHHLLLSILDSIPDNIIKNSPWLCFSQGATQLLLNPDQCVPALERAIELFKEQDNAFGELLASCSLLNFHVLISGQFGREGTLVIRTAALFDNIMDHLPPAIAVSCAQAIALGYAYYKSNLDRAIHYEQISEKLTPHGDTISFWAIMTKTLIYGLKGDIVPALKLLSPLLKPANSKWFSPTTRFSMNIIQVNFLLMAGNITEYKLLSRELRHDWKDFLKYSYLGTFLTIWDLDVLLSEGRYEEMLTTCKDALRDEDKLSSHVLCQIYHYEMMAHAHLGQWDAMDKAMRIALRSRIKGGGPYFIHLTQSLVMAALSLSNKESSAQRVFTKCQQQPEGASTLYHNNVLYAYKAAMHLRNAEEDKARPLVAQMLVNLAKYENTHFFGWSPLVMKPILAFAVKEGIHARFARTLARWRLQSDILDDGSMVPLMRINILGLPNITLGAESISGNKLSPTWQTVLTMLALAPCHELEIKKIQTALWPEEDTSDSRSKFDTMLSRLRSKLASVFGKETVKQHLQLKAQRLSLRHCLFDSEMVTYYAAKGLAYAKGDSPWEAHNAFSTMSHWLKPTPEFMTKPSDMPAPIIQTVSQALNQWLEVLISCNADEKALQVANTALSLDPLNDTVQRQQYNTLTTLKRPMEAVQSLKNYRQVLTEHDFTPDDIDHIIDNLLFESEREY